MRGGVSARQWTPRRLTHVGGWRNEPLLHAAVGGGRGQYTTPPLLARVNDELRIRRNRRAFVERTLRQHLHLSRRVILNREHEAAAFALHEHEPLAVGQGARRHVVVALEGQTLDAIGREV